MGRTVAERTSAGTQQARYIHGTQVDEFLTKTDSAGTIYSHRDGLGSVTQITNAIGTMIERYLYDIFGKVTILESVPTASLPLIQTLMFFKQNNWIYKKRQSNCRF